MSVEVLPPNLTASDLTDEDLQFRLESALRRSGYAELAHVRVEASADGCKLQGTVSCYYMKQRAQEVARRVHADITLSNEIHVRALPVGRQQRSVYCG